MKDKIANICNKTIEFSFYLLFFFVPLILTPYNYELFEFNKMLLTYALTTVITGAWVIKMIAQKKFLIQRTPFDIPIILFLISQVASTIFSIDFHTSVFGYYSRFHGGLLSTISYILLYYALVSNLNEKKKIFNILYISLLSGFFVAFYGILEHFGIDAKYWVQDVQNRVFSTLGQPNWLAAYLNILLFICLSLIFVTKSKIKISIFYFLFSIFYLCLLYTKSRSGFAAFIFCLCIYTIFSIIIGFTKKQFKNLFPLIANYFLLIALITFFVSPPFFHLDKIGYSAVKKWINQKINKSAIPLTPPATTTPSPTGPALEVGGTESGVIRKIVWQGALDIAFAYPLFGSGVETFGYIYYKFRPAAHNLVSEWDFLYNKAHNEFLNYAATTGFFGLGTYLLVIGWFIFWSLKNIKYQKSLSYRQAGKIKNVNQNQKILNYDFTFYILHFALLSAYITILITNFFGFSVVIVALYFWLIPAFCFLLAQKSTENNIERHGTPLKRDSHLVSLSSLQTASIVFVIFAILHFLFSIYKYWLADTKYALAQNYDKANNFTVSYPLLKEAISLKPDEPVYYDELSYCSANLAYAAYSQKQNQLATQLINEAIAATQKATKISPSNLNFWKTKTKVFYILSAINEKYNYEALEALLKAKEMAPTDAKIYYNLAILYGRVNQPDKAIETLRETIKLKNNYRDAYYALGLFLADKGEKDEAIAQMEYILKYLATDDAQAKEKIREWTGQK